MAITASSTIYNSNGQTFSRSEYQGAVYQEVTFAGRLRFDTQFTITTPLRDSLSGFTLANYPTVNNKYFMGSFNGFWIHKIYNMNHLVMTVQTVNQEMFIPVPYDRIESVCLQTATKSNESHPATSNIPAPGVLAVLGITVTLLKRNRNAYSTKT